MAEPALVVLSPRDHMAATVELDRSGRERHVATTSDGKRHLLADYVSRHRPAAFVQAPAEDIEKELNVLRGRAQTLDFALMLFDPQLSEKLKRRVAAELDGLLESEGNRNYALDVILSHPLSERADVATAKLSTDSHQRAQDFVSCVVESQERSRLVLNSWLAILSETITKRIGIETVRGSLIRSGVIRRLVLEGQTQADVKRIGGSLAIASEQIDARIVTSLMNEYREQLPAGKREKREEAIKSRATPGQLGPARSVWVDPKKPHRQLLPVQATEKRDLGNAAWDRAELEKAAEHFRCALAMASDTPYWEAKYDLALVLSMLKHEQEAYQLAQEVAVEALNGKDAAIAWKAHNFISGVHKRRGEYAAALTDVQLAYDLSHQTNALVDGIPHIVPIKNRIVLEMLCGNSKQAAVLISEIESHPEFSEIRAELEQEIGPLTLGQCGEE